jgi:integrase
MDAYQAALAGAPAAKIEIGVANTKPGSVAAAVALYFGSRDFGNLARATQRDRRQILERFREDYGDQSFASMNSRIVNRILATKAATPHAAKGFLKALRAVATVAKPAGLCEVDPTAGLRVKVPASEHGFKMWGEDDIAQFEAHYPIGTRERLAFALLLYTGQRRSDMIVMGRRHLKDGHLMVRQSKTKATLAIPIHRDLQAILAASDAHQMTFLTTSTGKPYEARAFSNWFGAKCREAGLPLGLSAHGLRKAMCRRLAEAGCTVHKIAAISGHVSLKGIERYTKGVDQRRLAGDAMEAITGTKVTNLTAETYKPWRKPLKT